MRPCLAAPQDGVTKLPLRQTRFCTCAAWALAFAGPSSLMAAASAGLSGQVTIGPSCSGPEREGQPCPSVGFAAITVQLLSEDGRVAGETVTDAQGRFSITAPPGRYRAQVVVPKVTRCPSLAVELPRPGAALLVIDCDSGRR